MRHAKGGRWNKAKAPASNSFTETLPDQQVPGGQDPIHQGGWRRHSLLRKAVSREPSASQNRISMNTVKPQARRFYRLKIPARVLGVRDVQGE